MALENNILVSHFIEILNKMEDNGLCINPDCIEFSIRNMEDDEKFSVVKFRIKYDENEKIDFKCVKYIEGSDKEEELKREYEDEQEFMGIPENYKLN